MISEKFTIYETFSPLYKALKLYGIIAFDMNLKTKKVAINCRSTLWMIFWWMLLTFMIASNVMRGAREPGEKSEIILSGWHWLLIFQLICTFYIQFFNLLRRKNIEKMFQAMDDFDEIVSYLDVSLNEKLCNKCL
jgi:hypothetical protein